MLWSSTDSSTIKFKVKCPQNAALVLLLLVEAFCAQPYTLQESDDAKPSTDDEADPKKEAPTK